MMILGDRLYLTRGESITFIGEILIESDCVMVPYTMPINLRNPHLLMQVRNTPLSEKCKGIVYNYFLPAEKFILQTSTRMPTFVSDKSELTEKNKLVYTLSLLGEREYYYYDGETQKQYSCKFKKNILTNDSKNWKQQDWWYSFSLVGGTLMIEYLQGLYDDIFGVPSKEVSLWTRDSINGYKDKRWLYHEIRKARPELLTEINPNEYFSSIYELDRLDCEHKLTIK